MILLVLAATTCATPLPPALAPYVPDGKLGPGDWGWLRGAFTDAYLHAHYAKRGCYAARIERA